MAADSADYLLIENNSEIYLVPSSEIEMVLQESVDETRRLFSIQWEPTKHTLVEADPNIVRKSLLSAVTATAAQSLGVAIHLLVM